METMTTRNPPTSPALRARSVTSPEARWDAVRRRDASQDGRFFYAVRTTGVVCRPSCGARLPRPENVRFFTALDDAIAAGFRPCKRCRPESAPRAERDAQRVAAACRLIETSETPPTLAALAREAGLSAFHFHRLFKTTTGLTPRAYASAKRAERVRAGLAAKHPGRGAVTAAIYAAGYNSNGGFYAESQSRLGMKPGAFRAGGAGTAIRFAVGQCSLGAILVAATERGVCAIFMGDDPGALVDDLQARFPAAHLVGAEPEFERWVAAVVGAIEQPAKSIALPLDVRGTAFQERVWRALAQIPVGSTLSYSELAARLRMPNSVRAVASAVAANPIGVAIPCHRVIRTDGSLAGYRWGVERKRALLEREASARRPAMRR